MKTLIILAFLVVSSGCAVVRGPTVGFWYTDTYSGVNATSNQTGNRVGEACVQNILGLIATGDSSIETARRNGGITMVSSIDEHSNSIIGVYAKYCVIVRGR